nr:hypothetical protein [Tanacetum cinerariifolium]
MANQEQNPLQQEQPFIAAKQRTIHKIPNMYKEYLAEFWYSAKTFENSKVSFSVPTSGIYGYVGVNTFRNAIGVHYLPHSREYVALPSIDIVRPWFETIGYGKTIPVKGTLKKSLLPTEWRLLMAQIIQCLRGKTKGFDQITNKDAVKLYSIANRINIDYAIIFWEDIIIKLNKRHRKNAVPYTRFLSLLMMNKMKEGYKDGVTGEARAIPQLSSGMLAFNLNEPIYSASFIIHFESASENDASTVSTAEADLKKICS